MQIFKLVRHKFGVGAEERKWCMKVIVWFEYVSTSDPTLHLTMSLTLPFQEHQ
jgi:hypothetical protein